MYSGSEETQKELGLSSRGCGTPGENGDPLEEAQQERISAQGALPPFLEGLCHSNGNLRPFYLTPPKDSVNFHPKPMEQRKWQPIRRLETPGAWV